MKISLLGTAESTTAKRTYPTEFRQQLSALARAGRTPEALAKEFEPSAHTIRNWVAQADRAEARLDLFQYSEGWYDPHRRHSALSNKSPITYERNHSAEA